MAVDVSIVARKAQVRPDPFAPLELENTGLVRGAGKALLSDKQNTFLGSFITTHLPRKSHDAFRLAVLVKLSEGRPGDAAFKRAMALAALEHGFEQVQVDALGLGSTDRRNKVPGNSKLADID